MNVTPIQEGFDQSRQQAVEVVESPERTRSVIGAGMEKARQFRDAFTGVWKDITAGFRMVQKWVSGEYKQAPMRTIIAIVGAFLYLLNPLDVIPDFIPVMGLIDDAAVFALVARLFHSDLEAFRAWEAGRRAAANAEKSAVGERAGEQAVRPVNVASAEMSDDYPAVPPPHPTPA